MTTYYRQHPGLRLTNVEDEGIVLHLDTRRYFSVNETGLLILEALHRPQSAEQLVDVLVERYQVAPELARDCVAQFLTSCQDSELVVHSDAA
ncbi:MAG TPA: PqqD family protein [Gemmatimonadales bacterium]|nr:PqqD family protein [Gemmatimonadales bacterium]